MTGNELVHQPTPLHEQMEFARSVVHRPEGAARSLLPEAYRDNPANVLLAVGLGAGMGLSPAESLYRIDVIQGKPCASAELISANVRKAGHKLRVKVTEEPPSATCTIIRADDPDEPTVVTRDMTWATRMGLASKDNYKKQPATMLSWRAISACARLACPEALYGVQYTPDEMYDMPRSEGAAQSGLGAAMGTTTAEQVTEEPEQPTETGEAITDHTRRKLFAMLGERGIDDRDEQIRGINHIIQPDTIESRSELTEAQAQAVIDVLAGRPVAQPTLDGADES